MHKHLILTTGILLASWALDGKSIAQTYDANAAFKANELGVNETTSSFGPFSVGYGLYFGDFTAFPEWGHDDAYLGSPDTQGFHVSNMSNVPNMSVNVGVESGYSGLAPGEILAHPGGIGVDASDLPYNGLLRFTAPATGLYTISGSFRSLDDGSVQNDILWNGTSVITITNEGAFRVALQLAANDVVDFSIGSGADGIGDDSTGLTAKLIAGAPATQIVNIDFNGKRPGDADDGGTYVGPSAAGIGTVFNGVTADSTGGDDNLTVSTEGLVSDIGQATTVGFSISSVGGDLEPEQAFEPASLYDDYIFNYSAGNTPPPGGSPFTISGLGDVATADLYFYVNGFNGGTIELNDFAGNGVAGNYNGLLGTAFFDVPVVDGNISGFFGTNGIATVVSGLTIVTPIPEPGAGLLIGVAGVTMMARRRRLPQAVSH